MIKIKSIAKLALVTIAMMEAISVRAGDSIEKAAMIAGVDRVIIERIIKAESGGHPYVINTNSNLGSFKFSNIESAGRALDILISKGYRSIDVGAAQINLRWHPELYKNPKDLLNPTLNIIAAGKVLKKNSGGSTVVREMIGKYHSPNNSERANRYASMVLK